MLSIKTKLEESLLPLLQGQMLPSHPSRLQISEPFRVWYTIQTSNKSMPSQEFAQFSGYAGCIDTMNPNHTSPLQLVQLVLEQGGHHTFALPACDVGLLQTLSVAHSTITDRVLPRWNIMQPCASDRCVWSNDTSAYMLEKGCMNPRELVNAKRVVSLDNRVHIILIAAPSALNQHTRSVFMCLNTPTLRTFQACSLHTQHVDLGELIAFAADLTRTKLQSSWQEEGGGQGPYPVTTVDAQFKVNTGGMYQELDLYSFSINKEKGDMVSGNAIVTMAVAQHLSYCVHMKTSLNTAFFLPMNTLPKENAAFLCDMHPAVDVGHIADILQKIGGVAFDREAGVRILQTAYRVSLTLPKVLANKNRPSTKPALLTEMIQQEGPRGSLQNLKTFLDKAHMVLKNSQADCSAVSWVAWMRGKVQELHEICSVHGKPRCSSSTPAAVLLQEAEGKVRFMEHMLKGCVWINPSASHFHVPNSECMSTFVMGGLPTPVARLKAGQHDMKVFKILVLHLEGHCDEAKIHALEIMQSMVQAQKAIDALRCGTKDGTESRKLQRQYNRLKAGLLNAVAENSHPGSILRIVLGDDLMNQGI